MSYTIDQLREWPEAHQRWVFFHSLIDKNWRDFLRLWKDKPRARWPGVYCIWSGDALLYIGYSQNVQRRITNYNVSDFLPSNQETERRYITKFTAFRCATAAQAAALEAELIALHCPPHNLRREPNGGQVRLGPRHTPHASAE